MCCVSSVIFLELIIMTLNYNIHYEERCGRMLVAARDIAAGEIIFQVINILMMMVMTCHETLHVTGQTCSHGGGQ